MRRAELLLAAGGDPRRELELDGRAVTSVAEDLDEPDARDQLEDALARLAADSEGLAAVSDGLARLRSQPDLAWQCYACALLAEAIGGGLITRARTCCPSERIGESRIGTTASEAPIEPMKIVSRRPIVEPSAPPTSPPSGITPQTKKRREAFTRPSSRSGVIAWIRLIAVTLKRMTRSRPSGRTQSGTGIARSVRRQGDQERAGTGQAPTRTDDRPARRRDGR